MKGYGAQFMPGLFCPDCGNQRVAIVPIIRPKKFVTIVTNIPTLKQHVIFREEANVNMKWLHIFQDWNLPFDPELHKLMAHGKVVNIKDTIGKTASWFKKHEFQVQIRYIFFNYKYLAVPQPGAKSAKNGEEFLLSGAFKTNNLIANQLVPPAPLPRSQIKYVSVITDIPELKERPILRQLVNLNYTWVDLFQLYEVPFNPKEHKLMAKRRVVDIKDNIAIAASWFIKDYFNVKIVPRVTLLLN